MPLHYLSDDAFYLNDQRKLCAKVPGLSLIMFHSDNCGHCSDALPVLKAVSDAIPWCKFLLHNVRSRYVVNLSRQTGAPINYTPYILIYFDGIPYYRWDGPRTFNDIKQFVIDMSKNLGMKQNFSSVQVNQNHPAARTTNDFAIYNSGNNNVNNNGGNNNGYGGYNNGGGYNVGNTQSGLNSGMNSGMNQRNMYQDPRRQSEYVGLPKQPESSVDGHGNNNKFSAKPKCFGGICSFGRSAGVPGGEVCYLTNEKAYPNA